MLHVTLEHWLCKNIIKLNLPSTPSLKKQQQEQQQTQENAASVQKWDIFKESVFTTTDKR